MPNFTLRFFKLVPTSVFAIALSFLSINHAGAQILWYNGDPNDVAGASVFSADNTASSGNEGIVYDDFNVTAPASSVWQVTGLSGDFLFANTATTPTTANWVILSGVTAGNGGTVVESGTSSVSVTSLAAYGASYTSYQIAVSGLSFDLAPGTYWLGLQPVDASAGYLQTTSGTNAIGLPAGNDGNAFWTGSTYNIPNDGEYFESTTSLNSNSSDFSLAVSGTVANVPEPSTWALALVGLGLVVGLHSRWKRAQS